jgi:hypothetical protein
MAISLDLNANQINQALNAAYTGLVFAGTGIVRLTGSQNISGDKTFYGAVNSSGSFETTGVSRFLPPSNASVDLGSASLRFKTGFVSGIDAITGYIRTLKVDNLIASVAPNLVNATGNNLTISGQTNIQQATISGNASIGGNATITGTLNVTGNTVLAGTVYSTGQKTFSGTLNQSGNLNVFGTESISGGLNVTGDVYCTGNALIKGNVSITGNHSQTGNFFLNTNNSNAVITGDGANHKFSVIAPMVFSGIISHNGDLNSTGIFFHKGNFSNIGDFSNNGTFVNTGNFTVFGNVTATGNFEASKVFSTGITVTGTSSTPALIVQSNLTSSPSGGAIEYNKNYFSLTTESTGSPTRSIINQTFSYLAPQNFYAAIPTAHTNNPLLGNTGIYLNTGRYHIKYDVKFSQSGTSPKNIALGITGNANSITNRIGTLTNSVLTAAAPMTRSGFFGESSIQGIIISGADINNAAGDTWNSFYSFDATITITGPVKIRPIFRIGTSPVAITGRAFCMEITQLSTGTGVGLAGANGPWSDV